MGVTKPSHMASAPQGNLCEGNGHDWKNNTNGDYPHKSSTCLLSDFTKEGKNCHVGCISLPPEKYDCPQIHGEWGGGKKRWPALVTEGHQDRSGRDQAQLGGPAHGCGWGSMVCLGHRGYLHPEVCVVIRARSLTHRFIWGIPIPS